jgi:glycosyltransferase involved in cell wall biosynthesis
MKISVVICAHTMDRWEYLRAAVGSSFEQTHPPHEVIVAVDYDDEVLERARRELPHVRVLANDGPRGSSGARNTAVRHASGDVIAFLDDDARAEPRWLEAIAQAHENARVLGTGGHVEPRWEVEPPGWLHPELYWVVGCSWSGLPTATTPVRNPIGANMSFVRDAIHDAGGFRGELGRHRRLPRTCDDTEFAVRALKARPGTVVLNLPDARVEHAVAPGRMTWRYLTWRSWAEGRAKAVCAGDVALGRERSYVARVLPRALGAGLRDAVRGDGDGLLRAAAIVFALGVTVAGYACGLALRMRARGA